MKSAIALVLLIALTAVTAQDVTNTTTTAPTTTAPTTKPPTTTAPTTKPPTTTAPTTATPTTKMTPTTAEPTTATKEPTTTPDQTTTHTAEVTTATTTVKPVITTPKAANHTVDLYVKEGGIVCILFKSEVKMSFTYTDDSNTSNSNSMYLPTSASAKGSCNGTQTMMIMYGKDNNVLTLTFGQTKKQTFIQNMSLSFTMDTNFPGINKTRSNLMVANSKPVFKYTSGQPYMCKTAINMTLQGAESDLKLVLTTKDLEYEAYRTKNDTVFGDKYVNCPEDSVTSNIVPIAVGAALAALVVIVLIAYLISRNRTKRGYESV